MGSCVAVGLLVLAIICTALAHSSGASSPAAAGSSNASPGRSTAILDPGVASRPIRPTRDPQVFARRVAASLFTWSTATTWTRAKHVEQLVAVADPTGESTPGLVADIQNYVPSQSAWKELARYETRQSLSIVSVTTPRKWGKAVEQAGDELLPGTSALTVTGVRHRAGTWDGTPVASMHDVTFTVFVVCQPSFRKCQLLRLSMPDKPLD